MKALVDGYRRFRSEVFPEKQWLYEALADGQRPAHLIITCSDSRVQPTEFTGAEPGVFFMERCLGNIVPEPDKGETDTASIVEYAVIALEVRDIIVVGHSNCGAMQALLNPEVLGGMPIVTAWMEHARETLEIVRERYPDLTGKALLDATIRTNVLVMLGRVRRMPCVAERIADGRVTVHGWVFDIEEGRVFAHNDGTGGYVDLDELYEEFQS